MTDQEYQNIPAVRRSDLWLMNKTPYHFKYFREKPRESTPALQFGAMVHKIILEYDSFLDEYALMPTFDRRTKAGKEAYQNFIDSMGEKTPVSGPDLEKAHAMRAELLTDPLVLEILKGPHEQPILWTDPITSVPCKCRADCITEYQGRSYIVDYKTTTSCDDGAFERSCKAYGYHFQAGMYCEGLFQSSLIDAGFIFIAQEKEAPYAHRVYFCDDSFIDDGRGVYRNLINRYRDCYEKGEWPGYEPAVMYGE